MVKDVYYGKTLRKSFARHDEVLEMPNLLEIQKTSYRWFLNTGLQEVFKDVAAITDYAGNLELSFVNFTMDEHPKYSVEECKSRDATYAAPIKVSVHLRNKETGEIKQQEIFMGDFPLMTKGGTFVINGAERVIVSQIVRSPGIYYSRNADKAENITYSVTVIPYRGAWLEYETDLSDVFNVRIDKNRKLPVSCLIRAVGPRTDAAMLEMFGEEPLLISTLEKDTCKTREEALLEIYRKLRPGEPPTVDSSEALINTLFFDARRYDLSAVGRYKFNKKLALWARLAGQTLAAPVANPMTGEIIAEAGEQLTRDRAHELDDCGVNETVVDVDGHPIKVFSNNMVDMQKFVSFDPESCGVSEKVRFDVLRELMEQYGEDDATLMEAVRDHIDDLIPKHITVEDMMASINYLCGLTHGIGTVDDIDHLGNRRLRCVGELLQNQFRIGFSRMERVIRERMTIQDLGIVTPQSLINIRPVTASIKEFFGSSPLSQFMDQTNPLAELTHKRRMSALGPGGLSRDRASFDVRDVHYSHYGRMCPIETPEGPNIGLISYLASYARINRYGFIEAPYRKVAKENGFLTDTIEYMTADIEDEYIVAQATEPIDENGCLVNERITCRHRNEIIEVDREQVDYIDVSPKMMVSIATAMIPFLEND
ncbi:MAG: DNA-directed RNA polymerase subunit beta, partial [Evtepia sp.]